MSVTVGIQDPTDCSKDIQDKDLLLETLLRIESRIDDLQSSLDNDAIDGVSSSKHDG